MFGIEKIICVVLCWFLFTVAQVYIGFLLSTALLLLIQIVGSFPLLALYEKLDDDIVVAEGICMRLWKRLRTNIPYIKNLPPMPSSMALKVKFFAFSWQFSPAAAWKLLVEKYQWDPKAKLRIFTYMSAIGTTWSILFSQAIKWLWVHLAVKGYLIECCHRIW